MNNLKDESLTRQTGQAMQLPPVTVELFLAPLDHFLCCAGFYWQWGPCVSDYVRISDSRLSTSGPVSVLFMVKLVI